MDNSEITQHYSQQFNADLEEIRANVLAMGGLVERQLENAIEALRSSENDLADTVVANDYKVNAFDVDIDEFELWDDFGIGVPIPLLEYKIGILGSLRTPDCIFGNVCFCPHVQCHHQCTIPFRDDYCNRYSGG